MIAPIRQETKSESLRRYCKENTAQVVVGSTIAIFTLIIMRGLLSGSSDLTELFSEHPFIIYMFPNHLED